LAAGDVTGDYSDPSSGLFSAVPGGLFSGVSIFFLVFFLLVAALIVVVFVRTGIYLARRRRVLREAGFDPMVAGVQMGARLANSALFNPPAPPGQAPAQPAEPERTVQQKLADLQDLFDRGVITSDELRAARLKIISS
jgi:hypothetical protein